jgi:hypothetical protein
VVLVAALPELLPLLVVPPQEISPAANTSTSANAANPAAQERDGRVIPLSLKTDSSAATKRGLRTNPKENSAASSATARPIFPRLIGGKLREGKSGRFAGCRSLLEIEGLKATCTVSVELALPFATRSTTPGLNVQPTPEGAPLQTRLTWPPKPPEEVTLTAKLAEPPTAIVALVGETAPVIPPTATATCTSCVWLTVPLVAVIGTEKFPAASVEGVVTVSVDWTPVPLGVMDEGLKAQAAPEGSGPQLRFTAELSPPLAFSVRVNFAAPPGSTVCTEGAALIVKSGMAASGVTENALGSVVPALLSGTLVTVTL